MKHRKLAIAGSVAGIALIAGIAAGAAGGSHNAAAPRPTVTSTAPLSAAGIAAIHKAQCQNMGGEWNPAGSGSCIQQTDSAPAATTPAAPATPAMTASEQQAVSSAQGYLSDGQGFSYSGLLKQLTSSYGDGFSTADATYALRYLHPDFYQQAVESAKGYLADGQGFSHASLYEQLTSSYGEGFTPGQADYALKVVGL